MKSVLVAGASGYLGKYVALRFFTPVKFYGPLEFFMTVLSVDMIAPKHGIHHLNDFFVENAYA